MASGGLLLITIHLLSPMPLSAVMSSLQPQQRIEAAANELFEKTIPCCTKRHGGVVRVLCLLQRASLRLLPALSASMHVRTMRPADGQQPVLVPAVPHTHSVQSAVACRGSEAAGHWRSGRCEQIRCPVPCSPPQPHSPQPHAFIYHNKSNKLHV